jgi:hypothetical protein
LAIVGRLKAEVLGFFVAARGVHCPRDPFQTANAILLAFVLDVIFGVHCLKIRS